MANIEQIPLTQGQEQNFIISYNSINYKFELFYNEYGSQWYLNISNNDTLASVINGLYLIVNQNVLYNLDYLGLGGLVLQDTDPTNPNAINLKNDLGGRLQLYRNI
jgi:hypothetical protein